MTLPSEQPERDADRLDVRFAATRAGVRLGWLSVVAMVVALGLDLPADHRPILVSLIAAAAIANGAVLAIPRRWWRSPGRARAILDLWSAGIVDLGVSLVLIGGADTDLDLVFFLVAPFLATAHRGRHRVIWPTIAVAAYVAVMALGPDGLSAERIALRSCLLAAATVLAYELGDLTRRRPGR